MLEVEFSASFFTERESKMILKLKQKASHLIKNGAVLLVENDVLNVAQIKEGAVATLIDGKNQQFIGKAVIGFQNKGIGWVFTTNEREDFNQDFVEKRISSAIDNRLKSHIMQETNAFRLFNGESDGLGGLTIDWYHDAIVLSWYSKGMYQHRKLIVSALMNALKTVNLSVSAISEKFRFKGSDIESDWIVLPEDGNDYREIVENGVKYATYLNDGLMTGIFLDQRDVRKYIKLNCAGQTVLNTFSYTGAFSVAAAVGNARETISVDVANRSLDKTKENFLLNAVALDNHKIYVMDVFDYFKFAAKKKMAFDWVILDPPSFARTKKRTFSVLKDYGDLLSDAIAVTAKNGRIVVSTNASNFSIDAVKKMIEKTCHANGKSFTIEKVFTQSADFTTHHHQPESQYLKVFIVRLT